MLYVYCYLVALHSNKEENMVNTHYRTQFLAKIGKENNLRWKKIRVVTYRI